MEGVENKNRLLGMMLIMVLLLAIFFSASNTKSNYIYQAEDERIQKVRQELEDLELEANAVSVYNFSKNEKIFGRNDDVPLGIASLAKMMTVAVAVSGDWGDITLSQNAISQSGDYGFKRGEKWDVFGLAQSALVTSANDAAFALAESDPEFLGKMNQKAKKIGMESAFFLNPTGLDILTSEGVLLGAVASASDVNTLAYYTMRKDPILALVTTLPEVSVRSLSGFEHKMKNTNLLIGRIPRLLFSKTGYTDNALGSLSVIVENQVGDIIGIVVLGSTFSGRFTDMEKIVNVLYDF